MAEEIVLHSFIPKSYDAGQVACSNRTSKNVGPATTRVSKLCTDGQNRSSSAQGCDSNTEAGVVCISINIGHECDLLLGQRSTKEKANNKCKSATHFQGHYRIVDRMAN